MASSEAESLITNTEPNKEWLNNIESYMNNLKEDRKYYDSIIHVGSTNILAHAVILEANSAILSAADVNVNTTSGKFDFYLDPQFEEHPDVVEFGINSLYDLRDLEELTPEKLKIAFKFSVMYKIGWLSQILLKRFGDLVRGSIEDLVDVFQFAHAVWSEELKDLCLLYMDSEDVDELVKSERFFALDVHCIKKLALSGQISIWQKFCFIRSWLEHDTPYRKCHLAGLLKTLRCEELRQCEHFLKIQEWLLAIDWADETEKFKVLKLIIEKSDPNEKPAKSGHTSRRPDFQVTLEKASNYIKGGNGGSSDEESEASDVTYEEVNVLLSPSPETLQPLQKQIINEFIMELSLSSFIEHQTATSYILNSIANGLLRPHVLFGDKFVSGDFINHLVHDFNWGSIQFAVMQQVLKVLLQTNGKHFKPLYYKLRAIEILMSWVMSDTTRDASPAFALLGKGDMCLCDLPKGYREMILQPYVDKREGVTNTEACSVHTNPSHPASHIFTLPPEMYFMQSTIIKENFAYFKNSSRNHISFLKLDPEKSKAIFVQIGSNSNGHCADYPFLLFDKDKAFKRYPVFGTSHMSANDLRKLFGSGLYNHLCVVITEDVI